MGFKDIFIKSDESSNDKLQEKQQMKKEESFKFPETVGAVEKTTPKPSFSKSTSGFNFGFGLTPTPEPTPITPTYTSIGNVDVTQEQIDKAYSLYQNGFDSLNQPGYDFYEFFKMVVAGGIGNAPIYAMAFAMGKSVETKMTKEGLINQADFYLSEITKVYENYALQGDTKKNELVGRKSQENQSLLSEVDHLKQQIDALQVQLDSSIKRLNTIDSNYAEQLNEVDCKIKANMLAKDKIIGEIQSVKNGITNNVN